MVQVDLHLHTTRSDGRLSPRQLVELAAERGLKVIALTDHDSTEGLAEAMTAAARFPELTLIPGIELSTDIPGNEIHILGYFIRYTDAAFQETLRVFREGRVNRARSMVDKLAELGVPVAWERVLEIADGGAVGRPHIAQALVERGYITYPQEAFPLYIGRNGPAYTERPKLEPAEAVGLITGVGGLAVLAHPREVEDFERFLPELKEAGLSGIEVHYSSYPPEQVEKLAKIADREGLIQCGGTDYHALGTPGEVEPGSAGPPMETASALFALARQRAGLGRQ